MMIDTSRRTTEPRWLIWAREMLAFAQTGLAFTRDQYNRQRYERPLALAAQDHGRATPAWRAVTDIELVHRVGGRAREAANYRSGTSSRTDLTLAARQLAQDIPQVVPHLLTLLRRKCLCELLDRPAPKRLDLRHQSRERSPGRRSLQGSGSKLNPPAEFRLRGVADFGFDHGPSGHAGITALKSGNVWQIVQPSRM